MRRCRQQRLQIGPNFAFRISQAESDEPRAKNRNAGPRQSSEHELEEDDAGVYEVRLSESISEHSSLNRSRLNENVKKFK